MAGARIPVLEVENLRFKENGRGIYIDPQESVCFSAQTWTGKWTASGGGINSGQVLPAPSAVAWLRISDGTNNYYAPLFNTHW